MIFLLNLAVEKATWPSWLQESLPSKWATLLTGVTD